MPTPAEAIGLPFQEAIAFFAQKTNITTQHWTDVWRDGHSRGFMVAGAASEALVADFRAEITKALEHGTTLEEFRRGFDAIVEMHGWDYNGSPGWRSRIIYETNLSTAYSAGRYAQLTEPDTLEAWPFWQYQHSGSSHPRLQHLGWNGLVLRADDPFWQTHYPPNGWRCGCRVRPVDRHDLKRMGKSGPDKAPPVETRPWTNPRTGKVHQVPVGIDPGFDYNPGAAWQAGNVQVPGDHLPAPPRLPARDVPPLPGAFAPRPYETVKEADRHLTRESKPWAESLSEAEQAAIADYKGLAGRAINQAVSTPDGNPAFRAAADVIDGALKRARTPEDLALFRGVSADEAAAIARIKVGEAWRPDAFYSTSLDPVVAEQLASDGVVVDIRVRRGQRGVAYIHPFPDYRFRQYEVLINRNSRFVVVERTAHRTILELVTDAQD